MIDKLLPTQKEENSLDEIIKILARPNAEIISIKEIIFRISESFNLLILNIKLCFTLQVIDICNCKFEMEAFQLFVLCIVKCPTLGWIFLKHNNLNDIHVQCIINKFNEFECLACLNLSDNLITKNGAKNLCDNIFRCPTLIKVLVNDNYKDINNEISSNLQNNYDRIANFHSMVSNFNIAEYEFKLSFFPTLINSFNNGKTLLHRLAIDEKYVELLIEILKANPNPYLTDICYDKTPFEIAIDENKEILKEYMDLYYIKHYQNILEK